MKRSKAKFTSDNIIEVIARDGEIFELKTLSTIPQNEKANIEEFIGFSFDQNFSEDKTRMLYWVLMDMLSKTPYSLHHYTSERIDERRRIGTKIKELRKRKGFKAKYFSTLINIDPGSLSRIEKGDRSVGLDMLTLIADHLGAQVDLIPLDY